MSFGLGIGTFGPAWHLLALPAAAARTAAAAAVALVEIPPLVGLGQQTKKSQSSY